MKFNKLSRQLESMPLRRLKYWYDPKSQFWSILLTISQRPLSQFEAKLIIPFANYFNVKVYYTSNMRNLRVIGHTRDGSLFDDLWYKWRMVILEDIEAKVKLNREKLKKAKQKKYKHRKSYQNLKPTKVFIEDLKKEYLESINTIFKKALLADIRLNRRSINSIIKKYIKSHINLKNKQPLKHPELKVNRFLN